MELKGWSGAYVSGAIGSVQGVWLTALQTKDYPLRAGKIFVDGPCEMPVFTGEIVKKELMDSDLRNVYQDDGHPMFIHIHASLAVSGCHVYGGGFQSGAAFRSLKVFIQRS